MRWRPLTWLLVSLMFFTASYYFWRLGDKWAAKRQSAPVNQTPQPSAPAAPTKSVAAPPLTLLTTTNSLARARSQAEEKRAKLLSHRLTNSAYTVSQLAHRDHAILLENALFDTAGSVKPEIPKHLQAQGDPGSYIVQSRGALNDGFRAQLQAAGAVVISYVPNDAYLVRASEGVADALRLHRIPP